MSSYFPYALSKEEMDGLSESAREEIMAAINKRYSKRIEPIRSPGGSIVLGPSESTGGYYADEMAASTPPHARVLTGGAYTSIGLRWREQAAGGAAAGGGEATPPGFDYGPSVPLPRTDNWTYEDGPAGGAAGGGVVLEGYAEKQAHIAKAEELLDATIAYKETFGHTSKTNAMGLEAFHYMRDHGIEFHAPLYPKKKKIMSIISYTDLGY
jgi:hypothetical protein